MTAPNLPSEPPMTQDNSTAQLERCPFCGGDAVLGSLPESWGTDNDGRYGVECDKCGAQAPSRGRTKGEARAAWNTRAPVSQDAAQLVERLRELAKHVSGCGYTWTPWRQPVSEAADLIEALTRLQPSTGLDMGAQEADGDDPIVGHKTMRDGSHQPLRKSEADELWAQAEAEQAKRASDMPTERDAINALWAAYQRLKELDWNDIIYCPKDGSSFDVIEAGSTGIFDCRYEGEWPNGHWWVFDDDDAYSSRPILYRRTEAEKARWAAAREAVSPETHQGDSTK